MHKPSLFARIAALFGATSSLANLPDAEAVAEAIRARPDRRSTPKAHRSRGRRLHTTADYSETPERDVPKSRQVRRARLRRERAEFLRTVTVPVAWDGTQGEVRLPRKARRALSRSTLPEFEFRELVESTALAHLGVA